MRIILVLFSCFYLCSCLDWRDRYVTSFKEIDYSFDDGRKKAFSIRLFQDGTYILAKGRPASQRYFVGRVNFTSLQEIEKVYLKVLQDHPDSIYRENTVDAASYKIVVDQKSFYVYGAGAPAALQAFSNTFHWIAKHGGNPIKTTLHFKSLEGFYPPAITVDSSAFLIKDRRHQRSP